MSLEQKIGPDFVDFLDKQKIDVILGCVDNLATRAVLNMFATYAKVPLIDGGSGKFGCDVFTYVPEETACLDCQMGGIIKRDAVSEEKETKKEGGCLYEASLIIPNAIAGAMMVNRLRRLNKQPLALSFLSGDGLKARNASPKCEEGCNPYSVIAEMKKNG